MTGRIDAAIVSDYRTQLREPSRPPSRGGNTRALHAHFLIIAGNAYSFFALGSRRWVFKSDLVSFDFDVVNGYNNIRRASIRVVDKTGRPVVRGIREWKPVLRTAIARPR